MGITTPQNTPQNTRKSITHTGRIHQHHHSRELALPDGMSQYQLLGLIKKLAADVGLNDALINQYELMISYTQSIDWMPGNLCICWLSVERMAEKLGKTTRQIRNNTNRLIELGLIAVSLDGSNRRGGQRRVDGTIAWAKGVDLKPVLEKLATYLKIAEEHRQTEQQKIDLHRQIGIYRAELKSLVASYCPKLTEQYSPLLQIRTRVTWPLERLQELFTKMQEAWAMIAGTITPENESKTAKNFRRGGSKFPPLYKTTKQDHHIYVDVQAADNMSLPDEMEARGDTPHAACLPPMGRQDNNGRGLCAPLSIGNICQRPEVAKLREPTEAEKRRMAVQAYQLGIHPSAVHEAAKVFGLCTTMTIIGEIHQRQTSDKHKPITNAGGYLRWCAKNKNQALRTLLG